MSTATPLPRVDVGADRTTVDVLGGELLVGRADGAGTAV